VNLSRTLPSASPLNFVAGLFAGAGINMLTSVSAGAPGQASSFKLGLDSFLWVLAAGFLTWAARIIENAEREAALYIDRAMGQQERAQIREENLRYVAPRAVRAIVLTALSVFAAILLLPGLIDWSTVFAAVAGGNGTFGPLSP
jgi:hypothetical protein